jgi:rubrerythrin
MAKKKPSPKSISEAKKLPNDEREKMIEVDPTLAYFVGSAERRENERSIKELKLQLKNQNERLDTAVRDLEALRRKPAQPSPEDMQFFQNYGSTSEYMYNTESIRATTTHEALQNMTWLWEAEVKHRKSTADALSNLRALHADRPVMICPSCGKVESSKIQQTLLCPDCIRSFKKPV